MATDDRDRAIVERRRKGEQVGAIAQSFGKPRRWVRAILKRLAPDLIGQRGTRKTTDIGKPKAAAERPPRAAPAAVDVPSTGRAVDGFAVNVTVQDVEYGQGIAYAHGIDERSNAAIFTVTLKQGRQMADAIAKGVRPEMVVQGHLLLRYDGATGPWSTKGKVVKA